MSDINAVTYYGSAATTASDVIDDPAGPFAGFVVTATGTVSVVMLDGSTLTLPSITASATAFPYSFKRLKSTGTSATIVGLFALPFKARLNPGAGVQLP